jgi:hypothetical protein
MDKNGVIMAGHDLVLMNSEIDHHQGNDRHGVFVSSTSKEIWVLSNHIHHNGGDGIQFCHGCVADPPDGVYIARNRFHSDRENGVDLKYSKNVIISENVLWGYRASAAGENWCFDDNSLCGVFDSGSDGSGYFIYF